MDGMRFLYGDTETTGFKSEGDDRIAEVALVEYVGGYPTGRTFHRYCNPGRPMPDDAFKVHGLSTEFLAGFPPFSAMVGELLDFTAGATVVFHNAPFDIAFLAAELKRCRRSANWSAVIDTLAMARRRLPHGVPVSLDALLSRYRIDASRRVKHGAMIDSELLAEVHAHLEGRRTLALEPMADTRDESRAAPLDEFPEWRFVHREEDRPARIIVVSDEDRAIHRAYVEKRLKGGAWREEFARTDATAETDGGGAPFVEAGDLKAA